MAFDGTPIIIKRKKHQEHAHHGGSWKVAYADFVTAMMAFFMVLWIMGLSDSTRTQIAGYFNDPLGFSKTPPSSKSIVKFQAQASPAAGRSKKTGSDEMDSERQTKMGDMVNIIAKVISKNPKLKKLGKSIDITLDGKGMHIELIEKESTFFESGSAVLSPAGREAIAALAPILAKANAPMSFEGHTDSTPYAGKNYDNWDLSSDRARALLHEVRANGVPSELFMGQTGYADTQPRIRNNPADPRNRRVSILIPAFTEKDVDKLMPAADAKSKVREDIKPDGVALKPKREDVSAKLHDEEASSH